MLLRTFYRQLYRKAKRLDEAILLHNLLPRRELSRFSHYIPNHLFDNSDAKLLEKAKQGILLQNTVRQCFDGKQPPDENETGAVDNNIDQMFEVLRIATRRLEQITEPTFLLKPTRVQLDVGQIFHHKKWGFRGVICGWYEVCPGNKEWQDSYGPFEDGVGQPFYRCLIDSKDRPPSGFVSLAAQENLIAIEPNDAEIMPVEHHYMSTYIESSIVENGRHVLVEERRGEFPDN